MTWRALKKRAQEVAGRSSDETRQRGGVALRLLICDLCRAVWPTERDEAHGGSRSDGEPCAYRFPGGKICRGTVHPMTGRWSYTPPRKPFEWVEARRAWETVLGLPTGTRDLAVVRKRYRELAKTHHPDAGGDHMKMVELNDAYLQALSELGQPGHA